MTVILFCEDAKQRLEAETLLRTLDIRYVPFSERRAFFAHIRGRSDMTALLIESGPHATETAAEIREQNPLGKFLWFSDLDFSLLSYRLHVDYFGLLPLTEQTLLAALQNTQQEKKL